jgi:hypothetical protein
MNEKVKSKKQPPTPESIVKPGTQAFVTAQKRKEHEAKQKRQSLGTSGPKHTNVKW